MIKVKATKMCYYGHTRHKEGKVFFIKSEKDFAKNYMVKVGAAVEAEEVEEFPEEEIEAYDVEESNDEDVVI